MIRPLVFSDERLGGRCVYCGGPYHSLDHVPSRVLYSEPHPQVLPQVPACNSCNSGFSADEEYFACLLECVIKGSTATSEMSPKVARIFRRKPAIQSELESARRENGGRVQFVPAGDRVRSIILKTARGLAAYELSEPQLDEPTSLAFFPLEALSPADVEAFEEPPTSVGWPEIGSRAFSRVMMTGETWVEVQENIFRYFATAGDGVLVRMVFREYLVAEVWWEP